MRERVLTLFKRSTLAFTSSVLALSTLAPLVSAPVAHAATSGPFSVESVCNDGKVSLNFSLKQKGLLVGNVIFKTTSYGNSDQHWLGFGDTDVWSVDTTFVSAPSELVKAEVRGALFGTLLKSYSVMTDALNCDATAPTATVSYDTTSVTADPVTATLVADEPVQDIDTWTRINDTTFEKTYSENASETVSLVDLNGNTGSVDVNIDWIAQVPECSSDVTTFDTFGLGSVNGQYGWASVGSYDQAVVKNIYGFENFGCQSLRLSNAVTSGAFGDQTFSYSTVNEAGEADSTNNGQSGGVRQNHYEAQFDIASTQSGVQPGLVISVSPDRGDGSRMSYLRFEDSEAGINVYFDDVQGTDSSANFVETLVASDLSRATSHSVKFVIDYVDGPSNDVVQIYIDGDLVHTGTTWENYYRYDSESNAEQTPRTSDSLIFRAGGSPAATSGKGFLFDNVVIATSTVTSENPNEGENPGEQPGEQPSNGGGGSTTNNPQGNPPLNNTTSDDTDDELVLGLNNDDDDTEVLGTQTDEKSSDTQKTVGGGMAWYWWVPILATLGGFGWWILAAWRRRSE